MSSGGSGTATVTETKTVSAPTSATAPGTATASGPASRASINLAVLNGSSQSGLARGTADTAEGLGYQNVFAADAPTPVTQSEVVYREGFAPQAQQVADDLQLPAPAQATVGSAAPAVAPDAPGGGGARLGVGDRRRLRGDGFRGRHGRRHVHRAGGRDDAHGVTARPAAGPGRPGGYQNRF